MAIGKPKFIDANYLAIKQGTVDLDTDTFICILVDSAHTPDVTADNTFAQVSANEITAGAQPDYVRQTLGSVAWSQVVSQQFKLDAAKVIFGANVSLDAKYMYVIKRAAGAGGVTLATTDLVVFYIDLDTTNTSTTGTSVNSAFEVDFNATNGILLESLA